MCSADCSRQGIEPGAHKRLPAKHMGLHVDHTTARHLPQTFILHQKTHMQTSSKAQEYCLQITLSKNPHPEL